MAEFKLKTKVPDFNKTGQVNRKEKKEAKKLSKNLQSIISEVEKLTVLELADLVKALEKKFNVSAQAPLAVASAAPAGEQAETKQEEKSEYEVILTSSGANKIGVIKALREINPELGLKEAKDLTESTPKPVKTLKKEQAEEAKKKLEEAGAQAELK